MATAAQRRHEIAVDHTAQAYLELLRHLGVRHLFANVGSDAPSILDAFARFAVEGKETPRPIQVPHETCAVAMAHGHYLATGEPPVVLVHSAVGTGNALTGLINAARGHVPLVLTAGRTSDRETGLPTSRVIEPHWAQEVADQGAIVRPFVKWDSELRSFEELEPVVRRAFAVAMSEPRGPVYLVLPMDLMARPAETLTLSEGRGGIAPAAAPHPDPDAVEEVAAALAAARDPLIITRSFGRRPEAVQELVRLAEAGALPVVEYQVPDAVNFPTDHSLHLGFDPHPYLPAADVVLVLDCPVPWVPAQGRPPEEARIFHAGTDPLWADLPRRGFPVERALVGDSVATVRRLAREVERRRGRSSSLVRQRRSRLDGEHRRLRRQWREEAEGWETAETITPGWISRCLRDHLDGDTVVVQEYDLKLRQTAFRHPGTYHGFSASGGLGFGVGGALGVKLAAPEKTVVSVVGDGTYLLGAPAAAHMVSAAYDLPVLWIVVNNHGWGAVKQQNLIVHPEGWAARTGHFPLVRFGCEARFELFARACGGAGEPVARPGDLPGALERAFRLVRHERRQVLLNVDCGEPEFSL